MVKLSTLLCILVLVRAINVMAYNDEKDIGAIKHSITKQAKKYKIEREILSCVLRTESNYRRHIVSRTRDYGIAQINEATIERYQLDKLRLLNDVDYSIGFAAQLLSEYRRFYKSNEINGWIARYNIGYQNLTKPNIGYLYMRYNKRVWACIHSGQFL